MSFKNLFVFIGFALLLSSCEFFNGTDKDLYAARVGDEYLYQSEIDQITVDKQGEDSALIAQTYIENWVREKLLLKTALLNLNENDVDFEKQLEDYRNSLIIYAYQNELINQKLDTIVNESQRINYYKNNQQNFELKQDLVKARIIKFINSAPKKDSLNYWLDKKPLFFEDKLTEYCAQFALYCDTDTSQWIPVQRIKTILPKDFSQSEFKYQIGKIQFYQDTTETLLLEVLGEQKRGQVAPLTFVKNQIDEIIRNRRRLELISQVKEEIFEEATLKKEYEIFKN